MASPDPASENRPSACGPVCITQTACEQTVSGETGGVPGDIVSGALRPDMAAGPWRGGQTTRPVGRCRVEVAG